MASNSKRMIHFFGNLNSTVFAVQTQDQITEENSKKLVWLFGNQPKIEESAIADFFIGPRATMITPWSTNAVEITQNMGIEGITRIEMFENTSEHCTDYDPMLSQKYPALDQDIFTIHIKPEKILNIDDIAAYNKAEGLALNQEEVTYLENLATRLGRKLTDSEVFGFSQANSEHCRHKIFNGTFIIDDEEMPSSLFKLIKQTSKEHPNGIVSAYKDNVAFIKGPIATQFAPKAPDVPAYYETKDFESVISLKAETHNFPTTVEPFNGAATGSGGEIRDRLAGGKGSRLDPLTRDRAKPAVPFGGTYRIVDFVLSNCLNSGLRRLLLFTQYKAMSLDRHINLGWRKYFCRELGEFIDIVPPQQRIDENWYQGTADAVYQNIYVIEQAQPELVMILAGDHIYKMDYSRMVERHSRVGADLTIGALRVDKEHAREFGVMQVDSSSRVIGFEEKSPKPKTRAMTKPNGTDPKR